MARTHRRIIQKGLNDLNNHDGVVIYQEPDILKCEFKWALGSITKMLEKIEREEGGNRG